MLTLNLFSQGNEQKNIVGFGAGFCPDRVVWIGNPINVWTDVNSSPVFQVFYARQVLQAVRLGIVILNTKTPHLKIRMTKPPGIM